MMLINTKKTNADSIKNNSRNSRNSLTDSHTVWPAFVTSAY
jgi:hypothetical protein